MLTLIACALALFDICMLPVASVTVPRLSVIVEFFDVCNHSQYTNALPWYDEILVGFTKVRLQVPLILVWRGEHVLLEEGRLEETTLLYAGLCLPQHLINGVLGERLGGEDELLRIPRQTPLRLRPPTRRQRTRCQNAMTVGHALGAAHNTSTTMSSRNQYNGRTLATMARRVMVALQWLHDHDPPSPTSTRSQRHRVRIISCGTHQLGQQTSPYDVVCHDIDEAGQLAQWRGEQWLRCYGRTITITTMAV